ncbi:uncharacterized protein LOC141858074 [Brevipalpus obovatus]|uniref:uncharacterized protein LOC141858074 n=1 Tax=Brevipalpus obovatus TaxID=246614 RepID=UPI003D9E063A
MSEPTTNGLVRSSSNMVRIRAKDGPCKAFDEMSVEAFDNQPDYVLIVGNEPKPIRIHYRVLMACSKYCKDSFSSIVMFQDVPFSCPILMLKELSTADLQDIFNFVYNGTMEIEKSRLSSIVKTARFLGMGTLAELKIEELLLDSSEVLPQSENQSIDVEEQAPATVQQPPNTPEAPEYINPSDSHQSDSEQDSQISETVSRDSPNGILNSLNLTTTPLDHFRLFLPKISERQKSLSSVIDQLGDPDRLKLIPIGGDSSNSSIKEEDSPPSGEKSPETIDLGDSDEME